MKFQLKEQEKFNFRATFKLMLEKSNLIPILILIVLITLLLNYVVFPKAMEHDCPSLFETFVFTFFQAMSVNFFMIFLGVFTYPKFSHRALYALLSFFLAGIVGTNLSILFLIPVIWEKFTWTHYFQNLGMDVLLNTIFGGLSAFYFYFQYRVSVLSEELAHKRIEEEKILALKAKSEMEVLRSKVNPHFLFNTLNSISSLVHSNPDLAEDMIQKLANLFRYSLDMGSHDFIPLETEIDIVINYLEIEKVRLNDRLTYVFEIDPQTNSVQIPPFLLQPLVENSIKHGISKHASGGKIIIKSELKNRNCFLSVHDNGNGFSQENSSERFGLKGIRERLSLHYGNNWSFEILTENGTEVKIRIPVGKT